MDPEIVVVDNESARIARKRRLGYGDIPTPYGLHRQSHLGPSLNLPEILTMRDDVVSRQTLGIVAQIMSQRPAPLRDRLMMMGRR